MTGREHMGTLPEADVRVATLMDAEDVAGLLETLGYPCTRDDAASRWHSGETGPEAAMARSAPGSCATCGFLLPIGGPTGSAFGVCANGMSPADGRVVSLAYGCGAHSEAATDRARP